MLEPSGSSGSRRCTSLVLGNFRARQLAELLRARGDSIVTMDDLYAVAMAAGWRRQAAEHAVDVLVAGLEDTGRLEQDEYGRPHIAPEAG